MFAVAVLEEASAGQGSIWVPVIVLGWFLVMTVVGWQVSRRGATAANPEPEAHAAHFEDSPSEFDMH